VSKIIANDTVNLFFLNCNQHFANFKQKQFPRERCLIKLLRYILFQKHIHILALEMASPGNRHCANCIGTRSYTVHRLGWTKCCVAGRPEDVSGDGIRADTLALERR